MNPIPGLCIELSVHPGDKVEREETPMRGKPNSLRAVVVRTLSALLILWMTSLTSLANPFARNEL